MTEAEKLAFWREQTFIKKSDLIETNKGFLIKPDAMNRVAQEYEFPVVKGKLYRVAEARDLIIKGVIDQKRKEEERRAEREFGAVSGAREMSTSEEIALYFETIPQSKKNDSFFIAKEINRLFKAKPVEVQEAISIASKKGVSVNGDSIMSEYMNNIRLRAVTINLKNWQEKFSEAELINVVSQFFLNNYLINVKYGQLRLALQESSISEETKAAIISKFYELVTPIIAKKYQNTKLRGQALADDILNNYGTFDMNRVFAILRNSCPEVDVDYVQLQSYKREDESFIKDILLNANREKMSSSEIVEEIMDFESEYPMNFIIQTIKDMEKGGLVLPYSKIYDEINKVMKVESQQEEKEVENDKREEPKEEKSIEDKELFGLQPVEKEPIVLTEEGTFRELDNIREPQQQREKTAAEEDFDNVFQSYKKKRKHRIMKREKAIKMVDRKMVVSRLIVASGVISTAALTVLYGVNPVEAARNCSASISSFSSSNLALSQILPAGKDFISILAAAGTTIAGTISWLRNRKKKKYLEDAKLQEVTSGEAIEDMFEAFSDGIGGRTR